MNTIEIEDRLGITFCKRQEVAVERGEGSYVWDEDGKKYLDFTAGWGVTCLGHSHPVITQAICQQAKKIIQNPNSGFTYSPSRARLLTVLSKLLPSGLTKLYFANSGAEANDAAIKLARKITRKSKIVSTLGSFHGRTFNTLSVSGGRDNTEKYLPSLTENRFVPFGDKEKICSMVDSETAAVILEPIQGEGGVRIPDSDYIAFVAKLCKKNGVLLIIDEIQTGFCRTGKFFAIEHSPEDIEPDILTMGKGIAGGFPFAAFAVSERVDRQINKGDHGGTYCGNPLGCAVATSVITYLDQQDIAGRVARIGRGLLEQLKLIALKYPQLIVSTRGQGLLCAVELKSDEIVAELTQACMEKGLLVTPTRNRVVRLIPSLLVNEDELKAGMYLLDLALTSVVQNQGVK
ncbi:MAG: aspartate aminotransferase family protein [SAR86 cluster bacterium]|uniref:Aspartate aminotransferase family protein n=1 Tax=SAR86 cluster bacterium TaxID=2030880 RepID=A0A2A5AZQ7_9GAMM|nr:MAG: aspartate aminotransferase family protein [SAR86 cluster bacterium]